MRLTLTGSVYITLVCLLPEFLRLAIQRAVLFWRHLALIIVVTTMDFHGAIAGLHDVRTSTKDCSRRRTSRAAEFRFDSRNAEPEQSTRLNGEGRNHPNAGARSRNIAQRDVPGEAGNGHVVWPIFPERCGCITSRILPGDKVTVEMTPYDLTKKARITFRAKQRLERT